MTKEIKLVPIDQAQKTETIKIYVDTPIGRVPKFVKWDDTFNLKGVWTNGANDYYPTEFEPIPLVTPWVEFEYDLST